MIDPYSPGQDIFRTTADQRFNQFTDPSAMAYNQMNNGAWAVDPNQLSPAYTAAYRPSFNGFQGNPYGTTSPTFWQSITPFPYNHNYGGNYYQQQSPFYDTLATRPMDRFMDFAQQWVMPAAANYWAYNKLTYPAGQIAAKFAAGTSSMLTRIAGGTPGAMATAGRFMGGVSSFVGSAMLPQIAANVAIWAGDQGIFQPYISQRKMTNELRRNFGGVTFGEGLGNDITGGGFSRFAAGDIAGELSQHISHDWTFDQGEMASLTDLSARSGLLDNTRGKDIVNRMKTITSQVKLMMQVANTSDFKEAIELMSKLQTMGVSSSGMVGAISGLGSAASIAGVSLQKMLGTVGAQGSYMFSASNLNPFTGAMLASSNYGSMQAAFRSGLLPVGMAAMYGGTEGMAQSATAGQLAVAQSPYSTMMAYNMFLNGGDRGNIASNLSGFSSGMLGGIPGIEGGNNYSNNVGLFRMAQPFLQDKLLQDKPALWKSVSQAGTSIFGRGKLRGGNTYSILTQRYGATHDQAMSMIQEKAGGMDVDTYNIRMAGNERSMMEAETKYRENLGFTGAWTSPITRKIKSWEMGLNEGGSGILATGGAVANKFWDEYEDYRIRTNLRLEGYVTPGSHKMEAGKLELGGENDRTAGLGVGLVLDALEMAGVAYAAPVVAGVSPLLGFLGSSWVAGVGMAGVAYNLHDYNVGLGMKLVGGVEGLWDTYGNGGDNRGFMGAFSAISKDKEVLSALAEGGNTGRSKLKQILGGNPKIPGYIRNNSTTLDKFISYVFSKYKPSPNSGKTINEVFGVSEANGNFEKLVKVSDKLSGESSQERGEAVQLWNSLAPQSKVGDANALIQKFANISRGSFSSGLTKEEAADIPDSDSLTHINRILHGALTADKITADLKDKDNFDFSDMTFLLDAMDVTHKALRVVFAETSSTVDPRLGTAVNDGHAVSNPKSNTE